MKVSLIGNCQIACVRPMLQAIHDNLECFSFPAVHHIQNTHKESIEKNLNESDWIFTQPVQDTYPVDFIRTSYLKDKYSSRLVVWPNSHFEGYAPEWNVIRDVEHKNYTGPLLDYHSSKILYAFFKGLSIEKTVKLIESSDKFDEKNYKTTVASSFSLLQEREHQTDINISDFIQDNYRDRRLFHIMNHPYLSVMGCISERLLSMIGEKHQNIPSDLFNDYDLISAWHPENPYIRETEGLRFAKLNLYRGTNIQDADTNTGFATFGVRLYDSLQMIEAFYRFYQKNRETLVSHSRVKKIMDTNE